MYENDSIYACMFLKCWNGLANEKTFIAFTINDTGNKICKTHLLEKQ